MAKEEKKPVKQDEKENPEAKAAEGSVVKSMPPMPQNPNLRMLVVETNGSRAEVRACSMQAQELLNILSDISNLVRQEINNSPPLHPPAPAPMPTPPAAQA